MGDGRVKAVLRITLGTLMVLLGVYLLTVCLGITFVAYEVGDVLAMHYLNDLIWKSFFEMATGLTLGVVLTMIGIRLLGRRNSNYDLARRRRFAIPARPR